MDAIRSHDNSWFRYKERYHHGNSSSQSVCLFICWFPKHHAQRVIWTESGEPSILSRLQKRRTFELREPRDNSIFQGCLLPKQPRKDSLGNWQSAPLVASHAEGQPWRGVPYQYPSLTSIPSCLQQTFPWDATLWATLTNRGWGKFTHGASYVLLILKLPLTGLQTTGWVNL